MPDLEASPTGSLKESLEALHMFLQCLVKHIQPYPVPLHTTTDESEADNAAKLTVGLECCYTTLIGFEAFEWSVTKFIMYQCLKENTGAKEK